MTRQSSYSDEQSRLEALFSRDKGAEGAFYYAVKSTGVFCRPGCSSRLPNRENVAFFDSAQDAERAGYRPCKRCKPVEVSAQRALLQAVVRACRSIEEAEGELALKALAEEAGFSPAHFHRAFKKIVGVTPKNYGTAQRTKRFRLGLTNGQSVTEAIYGAGFSSSSRAYESSGERLGMTPTAYRGGAAGESIKYGIAKCSLGWVIAGATARGVCAIELGDNPKALTSQLRERFPKAAINEGADDFTAVLMAAVELVEHPEKGFELPLDIRGTAFQERVWQALLDVPPGTTVSYAQLARSIGSPKAVRAVAGACMANKLALAIPCHRVLRSDGSVSGYRWGVERKRELLRRERER